MPPPPQYKNSFLCNMQMTKAYNFPIYLYRISHNQENTKTFIKAYEKYMEYSKYPTYLSYLDDRMSVEVDTGTFIFDKVQSFANHYVLQLPYIKKLQIINEYSLENIIQAHYEEFSTKRGFCCEYLFDTYLQLQEKQAIYTNSLTEYALLSSIKFFEKNDIHI